MTGLSGVPKPSKGSIGEQDNEKVNLGLGVWLLPRYFHPLPPFLGFDGFTRIFRIFRILGF
jgi:hypothetical protein